MSCHARQVLLPAVLALLCVAAAGCRTNPVTGQPELVLVGADDELMLGHSQHPNIIFMYDGEYLDPELSLYLGTIVKRLHADSHRPEMPTEFTVLNTSVINAFAIPGHVYATRGFLAKLENEAQFASVMGHELGHVTAGHSARRMTNDILSGAVGTLADYAVGGTAAGDLAVGAGQAGVALLGLSYSREQERQADRLGAYYMALAGWDAREAISMQRLLGSLSQREESVLDRYLSTHPPTADRILEIQAVIEEKELTGRRYIQGDGVFAERWRRRLAGLRADDEAFAEYDRGSKLLSDKDYAGALAAADRAVALRPEHAPFHRLRGDALSRMQQPQAAEAAYRRALEVDCRYVPANAGLGSVYYDRKEYARAEAEFAKAAHGYPQGLLGWYGLGMSRYRQGKHAQAIRPLELAAGALPKEPGVHYALGVCYDGVGRRADAYARYAYAVQIGLQEPERTQARRRMAEMGG